MKPNAVIMSILLAVVSAHVVAKPMTESHVAEARLQVLHHGKIDELAYQKPGAAVRIRASGADSLIAGQLGHLRYRFLSSATGGKMSVSIVVDSRLIHTNTQSTYTLVVGESEYIDLNVIAPTDGTYQINVFVSLDGLNRTLAHRFVVGDRTQSLQQKTPNTDGIKRMPAQEAIIQN